MDVHVNKSARDGFVCMEGVPGLVLGLVDDPAVAFERLMADIDFEHRDNAPRLEYYMNDFKVPYTYGIGSFAKTFEPRPWHPLIMAIRKDLENLLGVAFEVCFINRYEHHQHHLGWHADDSPEMDDGRPIVTVSLGAERQIWFRRNGDTNPDSFTKLTLPNGSACIMPPGFQDTHQHRIPKHDRECGPRISLTFRGYVPN